MLMLKQLIKGASSMAAVVLVAIIVTSMCLV